MSLIRFYPVRDLLNVEREFSRLFSDFENRFGFPKQRRTEDMDDAVWTPVTDIYENKEAYQLKLDLPGLKKEDVKISLTNGVLKISGERIFENEEKDGQYHRVERSFGKFFRSFTLPEKILSDKIEAEFSDGQLRISIPKAEEVKQKEVSIQIK